MPDPIDITALHRAITAPYWNEALAAVNDHEVRMGVMTTAYGWHRHPASDETFLVLDGELVISFEDREVTLAPGQLLTVPAGVLHKTRPAGARSVNLTFEKAGAETVFVER